MNMGKKKSKKRSKINKKKQNEESKLPESHNSEYSLFSNNEKENVYYTKNYQVKGYKVTAEAFVQELKTLLPPEFPIVSVNDLSRAADFIFSSAMKKGFPVLKSLVALEDTDYVKNAFFDPQAYIDKYLTSVIHIPFELMDKLQTTISLRLKVRDEYKREGRDDEGHEHVLKVLRYCMQTLKSSMKFSRMARTTMWTHIMAWEQFQDDEDFDINFLRRFKRMLNLDAYNNYLKAEEKTEDSLDALSDDSKPPSPVTEETEKYDIENDLIGGGFDELEDSTDNNISTPCTENTEKNTVEKDDKYYASIDEAHDGMWSYAGLNGMMVCFDMEDFLSSQHEEWLEDLERHPELKREDQFFKLEKDSMNELAAKLREKDLHLASGVIRRVVQDNPFPPCLKVTRLENYEMSDLITKKQEGNTFFLQKKYKEAVEKYDEALFEIHHMHLFILPVAQMTEIVNVLSNKAECHLRLKEYNDAAMAATDALIIDDTHAKTRIRRAKAEIALYKKARKGLAYLAQADRDIREVVTNFLSKSDIEAVQNLHRDEISFYLDQERRKTVKENPNTNFDFTLRVLQSKCW